jgi:hypothetical protein
LDQDTKNEALKIFEKQKAVPVNENRQDKLKQLELD